MKATQVAFQLATAAYYAADSPYQSIPLNLTTLYNNDASGPDAVFDPHYHGRFPSEFLPVGLWVYDDVKYTLPYDWAAQVNDNVLADEQVLDVRGVGLVREMHILYAGDWIDGESGGRFKFSFEDGSAGEVEVSVKNWWTLHWLNEGVIKAPYHDTPSGRNQNLTQIYQWTTFVPSHSSLTSITLPPSSWPNRLHIFAITLSPPLTSPPTRPAPPLPNGPVVLIRRNRFSTKSRTIRGRRARAIEVTVENMNPLAMAPDENFWVRSRWWIGYQSPEFEMLQEGIITRIMPSDEVRVKIWVAPRVGSADGWNVESTVGEIYVRDEQGIVITRQSGVEMKVGLGEFERRDTPEWWDDAKFGIFIHWGIFSVPAWVPPGYYAEWYQWFLHNPADERNDVWRHHLGTYGKDVVYDDFIPKFDGSKFNASEWVELFAEAGAKYFVLVTKHHDGFSLFDTKDSTHRSSVYLGPKRDFLRELFDAAKNEQPSLHRGTYYSLPEWFNPDAGPYGFGSWPGHLARNAYNSSKVEPYTGRLEVNDYLRNVQLAHMRQLAFDYETEIMWCDIGGPNLTVEFAKEWYPYAEGQGREVVMNNRCGALPQFDTPEYASFSSVQTWRHESSEGIDPYSYGYNRITKDEDYRSAEDIIHKIVNIVSKNGNYLLNLGPTGEGLIIKPMVDRLKEVGKWLKHSGECIYGTDYSFRGAESGSLRFTTTGDTFCIISLNRPENGFLVVDEPWRVPILPGDTVSLLGGGEAGGSLDWWQHDGKLVIKVEEEVLDRVDWAWAFKITYD